MITSYIVKRIKSSHFIYSLYYYLGTFSVNVMKRFVKTNNKLILFVSYGGRLYEDSPRDIYEAMVKDRRFDSYRLVWAFIDPNKYDVGRAEKISINSWKYLMIAVKARVWVTNVNMKRGLGFIGKNTFSLNTWHGTAIKHIGVDSLEGEEFVSKDKYPLADMMLAQSEYDQKVYSRAFELKEEQIKLTGFPRNDTLITRNTKEQIEALKKKMGIPLDKTVVMYAPTFRESKGVHSWEQRSPLNLKKWEGELGNSCVLLIRAHQIVERMLGVEENEFVMNFSGYPLLNDLLLVTDILVSDYSGILFDFAVLGRPVICYAYDYDQYVKDRGVYMDIRKELHTETEEDSLISTIKNLKDTDVLEKALEFKNKFVQVYGNAAPKVVDLIYNEINS